MDGKYDILYVDTSSELFGGGQMSLLLLLQKLNKDRFRPFAILPGEGELKAALEKVGVEVIVIPMPTLRQLFPLRCLVSLCRLKRVIKQKQIHLIHANTSRGAVYGGLAAKLNGIKALWHVRVIPGEGAYDRFLVSLFAKIIVVSEAVRHRFDWLLRRNPEKLSVIYNGVDLNEFHPGIDRNGVRREFGIETEEKVVGIVGNLIPWKGHDRFLRAAALISREVANVKFLIVGDGQARAGLENLAQELNLSNRVIFAGKRQDVPEAMAAMDVVVHSSILPDPFPRVVIEAMAMGLPVVAANAGGVPEAVEDGKNGILVSPGDHEAIAKVVVDLLRDDVRRQAMGQEARRRVLERFSIEHNVEKTQQLYEELLHA